MRLFFAIALPDAACDAVAEAVRPLRPLAPGVTWMRRSTFHLTLRFLGDVDPGRVDALVDAVTPWVRRFPPPTITLSGGGAFPNAHAPKVLWLGVHGGLDLLADAIDRAVLRLGFPPDEKRFVPHLTVGRVREGRADHVAAALLDVREVATFLPTTVTLYESHLGPEGARYEVVRELTSAAAAAA
jgi:2'-5' RNA ligase